MKRWGLAVAGLVVAVLGLAGCGIPTDDEPRLLADDTTTTTVAAEADPAGAPSTATVYLVDDRNAALVPVRRALGGPRSPDTVLDALLASRSDDEEAQGLTSRVPAGTRRISSLLEEGLLTIELSEEWLTLNDPFITSAYAQVVFTMTNQPGVERVRFRVAGRDILAQTPTQGQLDVVTDDDYATLAPDDPAGDGGEGDEGDG